MKKLIKIMLPAAALAIAAAVGTSLGIYVNTTESMPVGIWIRDGASIPSISRGDSVVIDTCKIQHLASQAMKERRFLKEIAAIAGDSVEYDAQRKQLAVNGRLIPDSTILEYDSYGRPIPRSAEYPMIVPEGFVFLLSKHKNGYDSRYFGAVSIDALTAKVKLVYHFKLP